MTRTVQVANAGISRYVVENLASGQVVLQCAGLHDERRGERLVGHSEHHRTLNRRWRRRSGLEPA